MLKKGSKPIIEYFNDFIDWLDIEKGLSNKSQENYARFLKIFLDWLKKNKLENLKPHQFTPDHVQNYRLYLSRLYPSKTRKPLKKTTQNYYLIALRSFLGFFSARDILCLPADKIGLAKAKDARIVNFLTLEQLEKLFLAPDTSNVQGLRDRAILETFFSTGTRVAELAALNREQINIIKSDGTEAKELEVGIIGKGSRPRTIYFSQRALDWLKKYLETRQDEEKALFINYKSKKDSPRRLTARSIEKMIKKYAILSGLPITTTPHVMRHSFATDLLNQGVDLRILQEFLGHKSITATQIYAHVTSKKLREIHQKFHSGKELKE